MENKLNTGRIILGGIIGGIGMLIVGFLIHGLLLMDNYMFFAEQGSVLSEPRELGWIHYPIMILLGIPIAMLYAMCRKQMGAGPKTALIVGFLVGIMGLGGAVPMYVYMNLGGMIPLATAVDVLLEGIVCALIAGALYKDKQSAAVLSD